MNRTSFLILLLFCPTFIEAQDVFYPDALTWCTRYGEYGTVEPIAAELGEDAFFFAGNTDASVGMASLNGVHQSNFVTVDSNIRDGFLSSFDFNGNFLWGTYFGGLGADFVQDMAFDPEGNILLVGRTKSMEGIATPGAYMESPVGEFENGFLASFTTEGTLNWATYFGGSQYDHINAIAVGEDGSIWCAGTTESPDLPVMDAFQEEYGGGWTDAFLARFNSSGDLEFCSYFGGDDEDGIADIVLNENGLTCFGSTKSVHNMSVDAHQSYLSGSTDGFLIHVDNNHVLTHSTYLGGDSFDSAMKLTSHEGAYYALLRSFSDDFATSDAAFPERFGGVDLVLCRLNEDYSLDWSSYYGGNSFDDTSNSDVLAYDGGVMITGGTHSQDLPMLNAYDSAYDTIDHNGVGDAFIAGFGHDGEFQFGTYYGSYSRDYASKILLNETSLYLIGTSRSGGMATEGAHLSFEYGIGYSGLLTRFDLQTLSLPDQNREFSDITVYPNPVSSEESLQVESWGEIQSWCLMDLSGNLIATSKQSGLWRQQSIDLSSYRLSSGCYVLQLHLKNGATRSQSLVVH